MLHPVICNPLMVPAVRPADIVKWRAGKASYPDEAVLYFNVQDGLFNAVEGLNVFQSSVLPTQYVRKADGSYAASTEVVDVIGGEKWLRTCGAVENKFANGDFANAYWIKGTNVTVSEEVGINGPCGQAYRYSVAASPTSANLARLVSITASIPHTESIFFKYVSGRWFRLMWYDGSGNQCRVWFDAQNNVLGTVSNGGTATGAQAQLTDLGGGWYKLDLSGVIITTGGYFQLSPQIADGSTTLAAGALLLCGPQLTATAYPVPYTPPGTTMPASHATTTGGPWFANPEDSPVWNALTGGPMTLATRVMMGVGSGDLPNGTTVAGLTATTDTTTLQYARKSSDGSSTYIVASSDATAYIYSPATTWPRNTVVKRFTQVNTAGTQFRVGYMIEGTHTTIQWSSWVAFDGSFGPSNLYKLMLGYNNIYPMWLSRIVMWRTQASDTELLEALNG